jgi:hypothetical protein
MGRENSRHVGRKKIRCSPSTRKGMRTSSNYRPARRHEFARNLLAHGLDPSALKAVLGKHIFVVTMRELEIARGHMSGRFTVTSKAPHSRPREATFGADLPGLKVVDRPKFDADGPVPSSYR